MNTATELSGLDKMNGRYDEEILRLLSLGDGSWLLSEASLNELHERCENGQLYHHMFTGKIGDIFYVADRNIISAWRNDECGELEYQNSYYWDEIIEMPIAATPVFLIQSSKTLPNEIVSFHDKMKLLLAINDATYFLHGSYSGLFENGKWPEKANHARHDIERMQLEFTKAISPILNNLPNGYDQMRRHQEYETFVNEREEEIIFDYVAIQKDWENAPKRAVYDDETGEIIGWERTDMD